MTFPGASSRTLFLIAALISAPSAFSAECSLCKFVKDDAVLCDSHAEAEKLANKLRGKIKREKDASKKIELMEQVAALTNDHSNAPSKNVAKVLASGLKDKRPEVRTAAARLLGDGQHKGVARSSLLKATEKTKKELLKAREDHHKITLKILDVVTRSLKKRNLDKKDLDKQQARLDQFEDEQEKFAKISSALASLLAELGVSLCNFKGADCFSAVEECLATVCFEAPEHAQRLVKARLAAGTQGSVKATLRSVYIYELRLESHQRLSRDSESYKPDEWYDFGPEIWQALVEFAESKKLPEPEWDDNDLEGAAERWYEEIKDKLPVEASEESSKK